MEGGDGVITLILGVVTILIGVTQLTATNLPTLLQRSPIVTGVIAGIVAIINYLNVQQRIEDVKTASHSFWLIRADLETSTHPAA